MLQLPKSFFMVLQLLFLDSLHLNQGIDLAFKAANGQHDFWFAVHVTCSR